jgi:glycine oxidase
MKIIVVGAGIAGLAIGWRLAQAGATVEILERGQPGRAATWAAAGMLAPGAELGNGHNGLVHFAKTARIAWPDFARELEQASGVDIGFRESGSLMVARDQGRADALKQHAAARGDVEWLTGDQVRQIEPLMSPNVTGALHVPHDAQVDNRVLGNALIAALTRLPVTMRNNCAVQALVSAGGHIRAVSTSTGTYEAEAVVLACGAWINLLSGVAQGELPPIRPAKGQMIALAPPTGAALPQSLIWDEEIYLVPKRDRVLIGATVEDAGFDTSVTRETSRHLVAAAAAIMPALSEWRMAEMWAGLRPRTPDDAPVLGKSAISNLYVAGGQFRNGILFAPAAADAMTALIINGRGSEAITSFDPCRFVDS